MAALNGMAYVGYQSMAVNLVGNSISVLIEEFSLVDDFHIGNGLTVEVGEHLIVIVNTTHYITSGFSWGELTFTTDVPDGDNMWYVNSGLAQGAIILGTEEDLFSPAKGSLMAIPQGAKLNDLSFAPGRRVVIPWVDADHDFNDLNAAGLTLVRRSIEWCLGAG